MEGIKAQTDEQLAEAARKQAGTPFGRRAASELFGRYQRRIYLWCYRYVHEHEEALDLAQDAMLNAYRKLDTFSARGRFYSWVFAITRNRCLNAIRRPSLLSDDDVASHEIAGADPGPDRRLEERMDEEAVLRLLHERLEPREQEALYLRCFEHLPVDEITQILEISGATGARSLLQKARRKLRAAMEELRKNNRQAALRRDRMRREPE